MSTTPKLQFMPLRRPLRLADDEQLVAQIRAGRRDAFEAVYDRHHAGILSFCRHMLGSAEEAEDVVQQTFAAAYGSLVADEREIALKPWLYAIARNGCLSVLRVQRDHLALEDGDARLPATVGLSVEVEQREDLRALLSDVQRLPEDQRAALILAELGAESHEEIALVLGVPAVKVRALIFQAREALMSRRLGRDADCGPIREQLSFLRGGARRRRELRHHIAQCAGCRAFEAETARQRAGMAVLLPVAPTLALKQSSLAAAFAGGSGAGGAAAGSVAAGGVTAGGVTAGSVGGTYSVVGGAVAGGSAAGGAAAGGAASIGGVAVLAGGGLVAGAKLVGLKALVGLALTGATASGYSVAQQPAGDRPASSPQAIASAPNQAQKTSPNSPAAVGAPADNSAKASSDPVPGGADASASAGVATADRDGDGVPRSADADRDGDGVPNTQDGDPGGSVPTSPIAGPGGAGIPTSKDGDRDGDGVPNSEDADRDGDGVPNSQDKCPSRPGTDDGCPAATAAPTPPAHKSSADPDGDGVPSSRDRDRDGDGVPNNQDRCSTRPGTDTGCPAAPTAPDPIPAPGSSPAPDPGPARTIPTPGDRDGDSVANAEDNCPAEPGPGDGCPEVPDGTIAGDPTPADRDGDGVPNDKDRDLDGDGLANRDDRCPNKAGRNAGCPGNEPTAAPALPAPVVP